MTAVFLCLFILSGCSGGAEGGAINPPEEGVPSELPGTASQSEISLVWNRAAGLDVILLANSDIYLISRLVYDSLFKLSAEFEPIPCLAVSAVCNGLSWTVKLRDGVYFHSGAALTAADVKYTLEKHKAAPASPYNQKLANISRVDVKDTLTLEISLYEEDGALPALLDFPVIRNGASGNEADGTGRYIFQSAGSAAWLIYNDDYFEARPPRVKTISLVPAYDVQRAQFFNEGKISILVDNKDMVNTELDTAFCAGTHISNTLTYISLNTLDGALSRAEVRRALSSAVNRGALAGLVPGGKRYTTFSIINPRWYLFDAAAAAVKYEPEAAKKELLLAGFAPDAQGVLLELEILLDESDYNSLLVADGLAKQLLKAGIRLSIKIEKTAAYKALIASGGYQLCFDRVKLDPGMDVSGIVCAGGANNYGRYSNAELEKLIKRLRQSAEEAERAELASQLIALLDAQTPVIPLYFDTVNLLSSEAERGGLFPSVSDLLEGVELWGKK